MNLKFFSKFVLLVLALSVSACATTKHHPLENKSKKGLVKLPDHLTRDNNLRHPSYKVGKTYRIKGKTYTPYENFHHEEVGIASWYGADCHGKRTATGSRFNMHALTCAHRTLQMPCEVKVTNLENGRSVVLTVADRGPYARNRIVDISREGAKRLGFLNKGSAKVHLKVLQEPSLKLAGIVERRGAKAPKVTKTHTTSESAPEIQVASVAEIPVKPKAKPRVNQPRAVYIQSGKFANYKGASSHSRKLSKYGKAYIASTEVKGKNHYHVRIGPFKTSKQAESILAQMSQKEAGDARILHVG